MNIKWIFRKLRRFFKEDFCYPYNFIDVDWKLVKKNFQESFFFALITFTGYLFFSIFYMLLYYITLPVRILNEIAQWWAY